MNAEGLSAEGRRPLRARLLEATLLRLLLACLGVLVSVKVVRMLGRWGVEAALPGIGESAEDLLLAPLSIAAAWAAYFLYVRLVEKRRATELGLRGMGRLLAFGLLLGTGVMAAGLGILGLLGILKIERVNELHGLWLASNLVGGFTAGFVEELLARVTLFRLVEQRAGTLLALGVTCALFGVAHVGGDAGAPMAIGIALGPGVLFGAGFILSRRLWLPLAMHASWNFTQGFYFDADGLLPSRLTGPAFLTGSAGRIEESVALMAVGFALGCALLLLARKKGRFVSRAQARELKGAIPGDSGAA